MSFSLFVSIVAYLLAAIFAFIPLSDNFRNYKRSKRIFIIFVGLLFVIFGTWDLCIRFSESSEESSQITSSIKTSANGVGYKLDKSTGGFKDSLKGLHNDLRNGFNKTKNTPITIIKIPILKLSEFTGNSNPNLLKTDKDDSADFVFTLLNKGNTGAYNLKGFICDIGLHNSNYYLSNKNNKTVSLRINKSISLLPKEPYSYISPVRVSKILDTSFVFLKINYTDSLLNKHYFDGIYYVNTVTFKVFDADPDSYNKIEILLLKNKILKKR